MWVKLDPKRAVNHKMRAAGMAANGLDITAMCWTTLHENDGFISQDDVAMLAAMHHCDDWEELVERLIQVGRWTRDKRRKGFDIKDYLEYNFSKADMESKRKRDRDRKRSRMGFQTDSERNPDGSGTEA